MTRLIWHKQNMSIPPRPSLLKSNMRQWFMMHALFLSLPGASPIYDGDKISLGGNIGVYPNGNKNSVFSTAKTSCFPTNADFEQINVTVRAENPDYCLNQLRFLNSTRQNQLVFLQNGELEWVETGVDAVLAYARRSADGLILCLFNLSDKKQTLPGDFLKSIQPVRDLLHPDSQFGDLVRVCQNEPNQLELEAYAAHWLQAGKHE